MTKSVSIRCLFRPIELRFTSLQIWRKGGKYFQLWVEGSEFRDHGFEISSQVCAYYPESGLVQFFEDLAANSTGWEGVKHWESPVWGLSFASWIDPDVGHVALGVAIWHGKGEMESVTGRSLTDLEWLEIVKEPMEQKALFVDAGQLEEIAENVKELFDTLEESEGAAGDLEDVAQLEIIHGYDDI